MKGGNGGIAGSGIFGLFGTTVQCSSTDTSMYCSLAKLINIMIMIFILGAILYFVWSFFSGNRMVGGYIPRSYRSKSNLNK
jgi:hypothetical protein